MKRYLKSLPFTLPLPAWILVTGRPDFALGVAAVLITSVIVYTWLEDEL